MVFVLKQKRYACVCEIGSSVRLPSNHMLHLNSENSLGNRNNSSCELRGFQRPIRRRKKKGVGTTRI